MRFSTRRKKKEKRSYYLHRLMRRAVPTWSATCQIIPCKAWYLRATSSLRINSLQAPTAFKVEMAGWASNFASHSNSLSLSLTHSLSLSTNAEQSGAICTDQNAGAAIDMWQGDSDSAAENWLRGAFVSEISGDAPVQST